MFAGLTISPLDLLIIVVYLVGIVALGCWAGFRQRRDSAGSGYFLAGRSLGWVTIGLALFSTNISTVHLVSLAEQGYINGLVYGNFEWMAALTLIALALFFAPFYIRSKVATLPDFLEMRYSKSCRDFLAIISIISAIFIHIGFSLYAGAVVLEAMFGFNIWTSIIVLTLLTGFYTMVGGLLAVVLTESIQTVVLLVGAICITVIAFDKIGGYGGLVTAIEQAGQRFPSASFSMLRSADDPSGMPWYSFLLGYPVIGLWYWCADQTIVQRVLGARDENHARVGALFAGFIKILPVFFFVLPGLIYLGLTWENPIPEGQTAQVYANMIQDLLPIGVRGVVAAALLAALMSTVSGALNSVATLFSYDVYKRLRPMTSDRKLVLIGRMATFVAMLIAIAWTPLVANFKTIYDGIASMICFIAPPITAVFIWGIFSPRVSARGALVTLWGGFAFCATTFILFYAPAGWPTAIEASAHPTLSSLGQNWLGSLTWYSEHVGISYMMATFYLFILCSVLLIATSLAWPQQHTETSRKMIWSHPLAALRGPAWPGIGNYKLLASLLLICMVLLYVLFA